MKWLKKLLGKKPWNTNQSFRIAGSHGAIILERLCEGDWMGGREACIVTKSHNGLRRLNQVKKMLRRNGIAYWTKMLKSTSGKYYRVIQILECDRDRARTLIRGA